MNYKELIAKLTLEEKATLVSGEDFWSTIALPSIGLRKMVVSDGPSGVRGELWDERSPSLSLPSASSVASTWNVETLGLIGQLMAFEARRKGVDVVLGPTINLHRSPLGGRHFECYSEDPVLSGKLASAFVASLQHEGVGGTLKHYVANDSENDRFTLDVKISDKTLHEMYLRPFEIAIHEANPWLVMSSYNSVSGTTMSENKLLHEPLKGAWNWDGAVVSDWTAVRSVKEAGIGGTDLEMPGGPRKFWGQPLVDAVKNGEVPESAVDAKVERILRLAHRVGALGSEPKKNKQFTQAEIDASARAISAEGTVLVKNDGVLPLTSTLKIGVFGGHALFGREQGGGSATVMPLKVVSPLEGLRQQLPSGSTLTYEYGPESDDRIVFFNGEETRIPGTDEPGLLLEVLGENDEVLLSEKRTSGRLVLMDIGLAMRAKKVVYTTEFIPEFSGTYKIGMATAGKVEYQVIGGELFTGDIKLLSSDFSEYILNPPDHKSAVELKAGVRVPLRFTFLPEELQIPSLSVGVGFKVPAKEKADALADAAKLASESDISLVFVGTNSAIESEGYDRKNLKLPSGQDELVEAVAASSKKTIVVINAGSPVEMPWFEKVDGVLITWFPGQQMGHAIADVIYGAVEPGGRLPTTWPVATNDAPVLNTDPVNGVLEYSEGTYIGYRGWHKSGRTPRLAFGSGQGYTTFNAELLSASKDGAHVSVTNTGSREGSHVVQIYGAPKGSAIEDRKLIGFAKVKLAPGATATVDVKYPAHVFDEWVNGWSTIEGEWNISLATNAFDPGVSVVIPISKN